MTKKNKQTVEKAPASRHIRERKSEETNEAER
jgi:hypothetical protein